MVPPESGLSGRADHPEGEREGGLRHSLQPGQPKAGLGPRRRDDWLVRHGDRGATPDPSRCPECNLQCGVPPQGQSHCVRARGWNTQGLGPDDGPCEPHLSRVGSRRRRGLLRQQRRERSAPTGPGSPRPARTGRSRCGTHEPAISISPSRAIKTWSGAWPSAPTGPGSPPLALMGRCGSGSAQTGCLIRTLEGPNGEVWRNMASQPRRDPALASGGDRCEGLGYDFLYARPKPRPRCRHGATGYSGPLQPRRDPGWPRPAITGPCSSGTWNREFSAPPAGHNCGLGRGLQSRWDPAGLGHLDKSPM